MKSIYLENLKLLARRCSWNRKCGNFTVVVGWQRTLQKYFKVGTTGESNYGNEKFSNLKREIYSRFCNASLVIDFQMSRHFGIQSILTPVFPALRVVYKVSSRVMTGWFDYPCLLGQIQRKKLKINFVWVTHI